MTKGVGANPNAKDRLIVNDLNFLNRYSIVVCATNLLKFDEPSLQLGAAEEEIISIASKKIKLNIGMYHKFLIS